MAQMQQLQFTGTVKSFNFEKGYGFIQSDQTQGKDVFLNKQANAQMAAAGDTVSFTIENSEKGYQAANVQVVARGQGQFKGTITNFNETKGFGFIDCEPTKAIYNKDVFFVKSDVGQSSVINGMTVRFGVNNTDKGPKACNIKVLEEGGGMASSGSGGGGMANMAPEMMGQMMTLMQTAAATGNPKVMETMMKTMVNAFGGGGGGGGQNQNQNQNQGGGSNSRVGSVVFGSVKRFNPETGWGFISESNGQDYFVMKSNVEGGVLNEGDQVQFKIGHGNKGLQATEVKNLGPSTQSGALGQPTQPSGPPTIGTVKNFNMEKGWGFIEQANGQDVFVMRSNIVGGVLNPGDQVHFKVAMGQKGMQAVDVKHLGPELAGTQIGTVKTFNQAKGWGFIEAAATAAYGDIFLHGKDLNGQIVNNGSQVQYTIAINQNGRPQAQNVAVLSPGLSMPLDASQLGFAPIQPQLGDHRASPY